MRSIKKKIAIYLHLIMVMVVGVLIVVAAFGQILSAQASARKEATERFEQAKQIMAQNASDFEEVKEDLVDTSIRNAEIVSFMMRHHDDIPRSTQRMREIAALIEVDEINIFDETGTIVAGTHPEYFGMTLDAGEQMAFFKPMLEDKSLKLHQEITPNSYDGRMMQYSAVWSEDGSYIIEIGRNAASELRVMEKYQLSYIFSLLRVDDKSHLYAISTDNGKIIATTHEGDLDKHWTELGFKVDNLKEGVSGFHAVVNGVPSYCVFTIADDGILLGRVVTNSSVYGNVPMAILELAFVVVTVALIIVLAVTRYLDKLFVRNINGINDKLRSIADGNMDERIDVRNCLEMSELSDHINVMVDGLSDKLDNEYQYQAELEAALKLAEAASKSKTSFLFSMSHDIRTPMNAILGFSSLAEKRIDDREQVRDSLRKINNAGEHLLRLINDVLDMARIESGNIVMEPQAYSLPASLASTRELFAMEMSKKGIDFSVSWELQDEIVFFDKLRMEQIELNLLSNALKYTPVGGSISYTFTQLDRTEDGYATYCGSVRDTGVGMSEEFRRRVFEPFEREHTSTVNGIPGTGLGLSITKKMVEMMNGTISCSSTLGVGSEFVFTVLLKVGKPEDIGGIDAADSGEVDFSGKRILLVEDNEINREIAYEILSDLGLVVETAEDGEIAVDMVSAAAAGYYKLILMDIQMPRMDGYQATRAIRALSDPALANIPIVALTANAFDEDRRNAFESGMNGHLAKPIDIAELLEALKRYLK